jgi:hypothetical protein
MLIQLENSFLALISCSSFVKNSGLLIAAWDNSDFWLPQRLCKGDHRPCFMQAGEVALLFRHNAFLWAIPLKILSHSSLQSVISRLFFQINIVDSSQV